MRLGFVSYLNAHPFTLPFKLSVVSLPFSYQITFAVPSHLNRLLESGRLDVALTSSIVSLAKNCYYLPSFCIASHEQVMSVNLYTRSDLRQICEIGVTEESATSVALLRVMCHHFWHIYPRFVKLRKDFSHDAVLLIGDRALEHQEISGFNTIDLAKSWSQETGLPFVFALFIVRGDYSCRWHQLETLSDALQKALAWSQTHAGIVNSSAPRYFANLRYKLEERERESLLLFSRLFTSLNRG